MSKKVKNALKLCKCRIEQQTPEQFSVYITTCNDLVLLSLSKVNWGLAVRNIDILKSTFYAKPSCAGM